MTTEKRKSSRVRHVAKWTGVCVCLLILAAFFFSQERKVHYTQRIGSDVRIFVLSQGLIGVARLQPGPFISSTPGWYLSKFRTSDSIFRSLYHLPHIDRSPKHSGYLLGIPLWVPFLLAALPTAWLWWRDRRRTPSGHCPHCGYNLTGNTTGICSECGSAVRDEPGGILPGMKVS